MTRELKAPDRSILFNDALDLDELIRHNQFDEAIPLYEKLCKEVDLLPEENDDKGSIGGILVNAEFRIKIIQQIQINAKKTRKSK